MVVHQPAMVIPAGTIAETVPVVDRSVNATGDKQQTTTGAVRGGISGEPVGSSDNRGITMMRRIEGPR